MEDIMENEMENEMENKMENEYSWGDGVFTLLSWFKKDVVENAKVMVIGAGALGNEVVKNLVLFGVGNIVIVDFDTIEMSNLTRSILFRADDAQKKLKKAEVVAKRAKEINPNVNIIPICGDLAADVGLGLYQEMDVVFGCLDSKYARYLLNRQCLRVSKPWIDGGIENLTGTVRIFYPDINCYECGLSKDEFNSLMLRIGCADIYNLNKSQGRIATTPVSASIIGAIQVQESLKLIHQKVNQEDSAIFKNLVGKMFYYEGMQCSATTYNYAIWRNDCPSHNVWTPISKSQISADMTIEDAFLELKKMLKCKEVEINMYNNKFVEKIISRKDDKEYNVKLPLSRLEEFINGHPELSSLQYLDVLMQITHENINNTFPYPNLTLYQLGIPYFDIIQVSTDNGSCHYIELTADRSKFKDVLI